MSAGGDLRLESKRHAGDERRVVAFAAAGLDEQSKTLRDAIGNLSVACLEWQPAPGHNTIGMLAAHVSVAEAYWMVAAPLGVVPREQAERISRDVTGLGWDDDGMPCPKGGGHPAALRGKTAEEYVALLDRTREATHRVLDGWTDASLVTETRLEKGVVTRGWILYHVLEHEATHAGQVLRLRHDLRDAGLLPPR
jgi:uncharacterized damage-inducible protein DinB